MLIRRVFILDLVMMVGGYGIGIGNEAIRWMGRRVMRFLFGGFMFIL
jgi:hypothetical protein